MPDLEDDHQIPSDRKGGGIKGQTNYQLVLARVCDWLQPGTGEQVFANSIDRDLPIAAGFSLSVLADLTSPATVV